MSNKKIVNGERETFGSRLGFVLISAGCAIGLGNVWRFPSITASYGGAAFIVLYLIFLVVFGLPIMSMEFAVGRGSGKGIGGAFTTLKPQKQAWKGFGWVAIVGNYVLMSFYTLVTAWMFIYMFKMISGDMIGQTPDNIVNQFSAIKADIPLLILSTLGVIVLGMLICSFGVQGGLEKVNKIMMIVLLGLILVLVGYVAFLDGSGAGYYFYLVPDFNKLTANFGEAVFAAMGQAFFTLSIGMGSMTIFGSYIKKDRKLFGEALVVSALDTGVAMCSGLIIIPACFAFGVKLDGGPNLIFHALPNVFNSMGPVAGRIIGGIFFLFLIFAAMSTVTAVFENLIAFGMDKWGWSRRKSCLINLLIVSVICIPCVLGFNVLSGFMPLGDKTNIMDLMDFIVSNNILPLGSLAFVIFCSYDRLGWGWKSFIKEVNTGKGLGLSAKLKPYVKFVIPIILLALWVWGYVDLFII